MKCFDYYNAKSSRKFIPPTTKVTSKTLSHWLWCLAKRHKIYGTTNASAPKDWLKARERIKNKKRKLYRDTIKSYRETFFRSTFKVGFVGDLIKPPLLQMKVTSRKNVRCVIHPGGYNLTRLVKYTPGRDSAVRKKTKKKGGGNYPIGLYRWQYSVRLVEKKSFEKPRNEMSEAIWFDGCDK